MNDKIKTLAVDIVEFYHDLDPYEASFSDALEGVLVTYQDLEKGNKASYIDALKSLKEDVEDGWATWTCDDLIERLCRL